jgi:hypothetical protein
VVPGEPAGPAGPAAPVAAEFAERWDRPPLDTSAAPPTPARIPSQIPAARPGRRPVLIGMAIVVLAALVGVGWAVFRPTGDRSAAPSPSTMAPAGASSAPPRSAAPPAATLG